MKTAATFVVLFAAAVAMKLEESPPAERKPLEQSTGRCVEYGIDYSGYDIDTLTGIQHWQDCAYKCRDHKACAYWSWSTTSHKCYQACAYWSWSTTSHKCYLRSSNLGRHEVGQAISGSNTCLSEC